MYAIKKAQIKGIISLITKGKKLGALMILNRIKASTNKNMSFVKLKYLVIEIPSLLVISGTHYTKFLNNMKKIVDI